MQYQPIRKMLPKRAKHSHALEIVILLRFSD